MNKTAPKCVGILYSRSIGATHMFKLAIVAAVLPDISKLE